MPMGREELLLLCAKQSGWIASWQLRELGIDRTAAWRMVKKGTLAQVDGLYSVPELAGSQESRIWRAVLGTRGVVSHRTAAQRLGAYFPSEQTEVLIALPHGARPPTGVVVHRTRRLPSSHVLQDRQGFSLTSGPRTFVDLCAPREELTEGQLVRTLDALLIAGNMNLGWLSWFIDSEARYLSGCRRAGHLIRRHHVVDSAAERHLSDLLKAAGLSPFVSQFEVRSGDRLLARVDFAWPSEKVALELDGYRYHSGRKAFVTDRQRGNEIELAGWTLLRTTPFELDKEPNRLLDVVKRAVGSAVLGGSEQGAHTRR
jgi:very-short-patch-repair endonuclease